MMCISLEGEAVATRIPSLDEEFAREAFSRFLRTVGASQEISWEVGPDPPDYFVTIGSTRCAVEVTRVVARVRVDGVMRSKRGAFARLSRFVERTRAAASSKNLLSGAYVLSVHPIDNLDKIGPLAEAAILDYLARTKSLAKAPVELVLGRKAPGWHIEKYGSHKDMLFQVTSDGKGGSLLGKVLQDFPSLVKTAVETKQRKLATMPAPRILLLVDDYHYARSEDWQAMASLCSCKGFQVVARTFDEYDCQVLWSEDTETFLKGVKQG